MKLLRDIIVGLGPEIYTGFYVRGVIKSGGVYPVQPHDTSQCGYASWGVRNPVEYTPPTLGV